ncbi:Protein transport protein [Neofusicoccum parvum]|nr:Protein transport protein [Neofusicoccum parvum]
MLLFGLGGLFYVSVLLVNAIAVLSEDRFLARSKPSSARYICNASRLASPLLPLRAQLLLTHPAVPPLPHSIAITLWNRADTTRLIAVGWGQSAEPGFGGAQDTQSVKAKLINLIASVRTLMRIPLIGINTMVILYELILG